MRRLPFMALGILGLVTGLVARVARMGWLNLTAPHTQWHGPLMVSGFLGTVISLERAIATGKRWAYAAPVLTGVGALTLVGILPWKVAAGLILAGSVVATLTFVFLHARIDRGRSWSWAQARRAGRRRTPRGFSARRSTNSSRRGSASSP
jgi:hypothetical protein